MLTHKLEPEVAQIGLRLLDDAHLAWLTAATESASALHAWLADSRGSRPQGYCSYLAALDREEAAAHDFKRLWDLSAPCRERLAEGARGELG